MRTFLKTNRVFILLLILIIFTRIFKVADFFIFRFDEEYQALLAWEQVKNFHLIWIGTSVSNINYYLGPGGVYLNYFLFLISKGDPIILAYFSAFFSVITTISIYYITSKLFSKRIALFAFIIYGFSTLINYYNRRFWNPQFIPFISIWFVYSLIKADKDSRWYILTAILFGSIFHVHMTLLLFIVPTIYSLIINFRKIKIKTWVIMIISYLIITLPMIVFDIVHNFDNLLMPYRLLFDRGKTGLSIFSIHDMSLHLIDILFSLSRLWFTKLNTTVQEIVLSMDMGQIRGYWYFSILSIIALIIFFLKSRKSGYRIFFISLIIIPLAYIIYPSYNSEYYLMSFIALMTIVIGYWLNKLPKYLAYIIVVLFIGINTLTIITTSDKYGLTQKKVLIKQTMTVIKDQNFRLDTIGTLPNPQFAYAGWRYLFKVYGKTPGQSNVDMVFGWIYPDEIDKSNPSLKVIVAENIQPKFDKKPLYIFRSGIYYAYIFKNE